MRSNVCLDEDLDVCVLCLYASVFLCVCMYVCVCMCGVCMCVCLWAGKIVDLHFHLGPLTFRTSDLLDFSKINR